MMNSLVLIVLAILSTTFAEKGAPCTTPDGKSATCVPLNTCQTVFEALSGKTDGDLDFAKKSNCGYDNQPLVCCESPGAIIQPNYETKDLPDGTVCGSVKEANRITGGELTKLGEFPWMVGIEFKSRENNKDDVAKIYCAGTLINNRVVLTTGTCLSSSQYEPVKVWIGDWKLSTDPDCVELLANVECADPIQKVGIKKIIAHPYYNKKSGYNDIGLIFLENEVTFSDYIRPICLPLSNLTSLEPGNPLVVIGWGTTENNTVSDILLKIDVPYVENQECNEKYKHTKKVVSTQQLCAGGDGKKDSCSGDSGGPIMRTSENKITGKTVWYQEGIVSYGPRCGVTTMPAVYTKISSYMDWIINTISKH